jgi:acetoin utilization protein AcuB
LLGIQLDILQNKGWNMPGVVTIKSVMSNFPYSIEISAHANSAKTMLEQMKIHHLPVTQDGSPVGIVTVRDISKAKYLGVDVSIGSDILVRHVYTPSTYIVTPNEPLDNVLHHMAMQHIDAALVLENDKLVGIFTVTDACMRYAELLKQKPKTGKKTNEEISLEIDKEFLS